MRTLSKTESKVMENTGKTVTTLEVVGILNCKKNQANVVLHRMKEKGWLKRVKKGLYVKKDEVDSPYELLNILSNNFYVSFLTALNFHHLTTQVPTAILAVSPDSREELIYKDIKIKLIKTVEKKFFGWEKEKIEGVETKIATPEKALLDSLDKPKYAGGLEHVISCFKDFNSNLIARYALRIDNRALIRRLGAILSFKDKLPSTELQEKLLEKAQARSYYTSLRKGEKEGKKIKQWKVVWNVE